jgi:amidase
MKQAQTADVLVKAQTRVGPLHGLPITVKDAMQLSGYLCAKGSVGLRSYRARQDATIVKRIKDAGAIILGQTNVPELLLAYETDNDLYGVTRNPHDVTLTSGGSSGGEAAAIAAGGSPAGLASDAAGSVRVPAHFCGTSGLKVTQGRIPSTGNVPIDGPGVSSRFSSYGLIARWVDDLQMLFEVVAGGDGIDPYAPPVFPRTSESALNKLRIAYYHEQGGVSACQETQSAINKCIDALNGHVSVCQQAQPDEIDRAYTLLFETLLLGGDRGQSWRDIQSRLNIEKPSQLFSQFLELAKSSSFSLTEFRQRLALIDQYCFSMLKFMQQYDIIICPVASTPALPHGSAMKNVKNFSFCMPFSLTGWPVVTIPIKKSQDNLPIGVQIVAKPWHEHHALSVAKYLEQNIGGWQRISYPITQQLFTD